MVDMLELHKNYALLHTISVSIIKHTFTTHSLGTTPTSIFLTNPRVAATQLIPSITDEAARISRVKISIISCCATDHSIFGTIR